MIGNIIGEVFEVMSAGAFASFFTNKLPGIWNALKSGMTHPVVQEWGKRKLAPKGLQDESIFGYLFAKANMGDKKPMLIRVLRQLEDVDHKLGTKFAQNFRLIIALDAIGRGIIDVTQTTDKDGKVTIKKTPGECDKHSGIPILELMARECNTEAEMMQFVIAIGAMQDAPFGTIGEFKHWATEVALPTILSFFDSNANLLGNGITHVTRFVNRQYEERTARAFERDRLRRENGFHWINPILWFQWFIDLR
ncbi:MAG: hypothetical protein WAV73_03100 [Candidatus Moraniibacteriota bacterium]